MTEQESTPPRSSHLFSSTYSARIPPSPAAVSAQRNNLTLLQARAPITAPAKSARDGETRNEYHSASRTGWQVKGYLISMVATPSNFFLMASASSLVAFSFSALGAPSTRSLASFRPSEVTSRTALMVLILFAPASLRMTWNSVFSSTTAATAAPPPAARHWGRCRRRNSKPLFQLLYQSRCFQQAQAYNLLFQLREIRHVFLHSELF